MAKEKSNPDEAPMPEHTDEDNCPACAEEKRVIAEMEKSPMIKRFMQITKTVKDEIEALEKEYGARITLIHLITLENKQTDRIKAFPKNVALHGKSRKRMHNLAEELAMHIAKVELQTAMEDLPPEFADALKKAMGNVPERPKHNIPYMGKGGEA